MNTNDELLELEDPPHITALNASQYIQYLENLLNLDLRGRSRAVAPSRTMTLRPRPTTTTIWGDEYYDGHQQ